MNRPDLDDLQRERDFLAALVELLQHQAPDAFVREALRPLVDITGAAYGYLELHDPDGGAPFSTAIGADDEEVDAIRRSISHGIVAEAVATGALLHTTSAIADPRFRDNESVRGNAIQAVLCCPIGRRVPVGVAYLQGSATGGPFRDADQRHLSRFAQVLAPLAEQILAHARAPGAPAERLLEVPGVVARSPAMRGTLRRLAVAAELDVHLLFTGPSGTGKSMLARAVHRESKRSDGPYVELNCATIPEPLFENELFGAAAGAHSTAPAGGSEGKVAAAEGGTLFLDEVTELSPPAQAKLLQLLQSKSYYRLGEATLRRADVRVLAATNADLAQAVEEGRLREDLLYRLRVLEVRVPTLAERTEDLSELAGVLTAAACERHGLPPLSLAPSAHELVQSSSWPGNVRELAHALEAAAVSARLEEAERIEGRHFDAGPMDAAGESAPPVTLQRRLHAFRGHVVREALEETDWNVSEAARRLDVARSYLYRLIRAHGLRRE